MKRMDAHSLSALTLALTLSLPCFAESPTNLLVKSGSVKFQATTNLSAISVHGQSAAIQADVIVRPAADSTTIANIRAILDPQSLSTGMAIRDQHMRKRVFTTADNRMPPLEFSAEAATCPAFKQGQDIACEVKGELILRGVAKPFAMTLKIRNEGKGYRASGDAAVKLSDYGIEPPCQLGVCVADLVKFRLDLQAKETLGMRSGGIR